MIGKMKNENPGDDITKFIGLRPKVYSIETVNGVNTNKVKGCSSRRVSFGRYRQVLEFDLSTFQARCLLQSRRMNIATVEVTKTELTPFDDKRYLLENKVTSLPYGHYKIQQQ